MWGLRLGKIENIERVNLPIGGRPERITKSLLWNGALKALEKQQT